MQLSLVEQHYHERICKIWAMVDKAVQEQQLWYWNVASSAESIEGPDINASVLQGACGALHALVLWHGPGIFLVSGHPSVVFCGLV